MKSELLVYDTTLRDGAQSVGVTFSLGDKLRVMEALDDLGVHYIEAGWPGSNPKDEAFFAEASRRTLATARLTAFGSTRMKDIPAEKDRNLELLLRSGCPVITIFGKSWDLHVRDALGTTKEENLEMIYSSIRYLKRHVDEVVFDGEHFFDGYFADREYAVASLEAAVQAGADWLVLCDTNGGRLPDQIREATSSIVSAFDVPIGIHAHNDAGCAVANTLEAVDLGARMVQGTINGIGERCGNANLCVVLPNLSIKKGYGTIGEENMKKLQTLSHFVAEVSNTTPDDHMPFVGQHAFSHKGGIHVSAIRKNTKTYEHIDPELVGNRRSTTISELSGKSNILEKTKHMGVGRRLTGETARKIVEKVKELEARGYHFEGAEASFELLSEALTGNLKEYFTLHGYRVIVWNNGDGNTWSEVTIKASVPEDVSNSQGHSDSVEHTSADGNGPVEALDKALRKVLEKFYPNIRETRLIDYKVRILNEESGSSAITRVIINSADEESSWGTVGVSENIIEASWQALTDSLIYKLKKDEEKSRDSGKKSGSRSKKKEKIYGSLY
jgi:2-isopropylmalate synthase